jgi:hypothetical protein
MTSVTNKSTGGNTNKYTILSQLNNKNDQMLLFNPRLTDGDWSIHQLPPLCTNKGKYGQFRWSQFSNPFDTENYHEITTQLLQSPDIPDMIDDHPIYIMGIKYKHLPGELWGDGNDVQIGYTGTSDIVDFPNVDFPNVDFPNVDFPNVDFPNVDFPNTNLHIPYDNAALEEYYSHDFPSIATNTLIRECKEEMAFSPNVDNIAWLYSPDTLHMRKNKKWIAGTMLINDCTPANYSKEPVRKIIKNDPGQRKYIKCAGIIWGTIEQLVKAIVEQFGERLCTHHMNDGDDHHYRDHRDHRDHRDSFGRILDGDSIEGIVLLPKKQTLELLMKSLELYKSIRDLSTIMIQCKNCNVMFSFTVKQQHYYSKNNWNNPIRCKTCRSHNNKQNK